MVASRHVELHKFRDGLDAELQVVRTRSVRARSPTRQRVGLEGLYLQIAKMGAALSKVQHAMHIRADDDDSAPALHRRPAATATSTAAFHGLQAWDDNAYRFNDR